MKLKEKKEERRKFLGGLLATCIGTALVGSASKAKATPKSLVPEGKETLYRRTSHVETYLRTLED